MKEFLQRLINRVATKYSDRRRVEEARYERAMIKLMDYKIALAKQEAEVKWLREWTPNNPKPPRRVPHFTLWISFSENDSPVEIQLTADNEKLIILRYGEGVNLRTVWDHFVKLGWTCWKGNGLEPKFGHAYRISAPLP